MALQYCGPGPAYANEATRHATPASRRRWNFDFDFIVITCGLFFPVRLKYVFAAPLFIASIFRVRTGPDGAVRNEPGRWASERRVLPQRSVLKAARSSSAKSCG